MKQPSHKQIERAVGYRFKRKALLDNALTHRSYRYESDKDIPDNQRLEFLGDAALGLVTAAHLFKLFPRLQEGDLTRLRSRLASAESLAIIASRLDLGKHLLLGRGEQTSGGHSRESNLVDALEAIIGAVYLDGGLRAVHKLFLKLFANELKMLSLQDWGDNPKGALQERAQKEWRINPSYKVIHEEGPSHARLFTVQVSIKGKQLGSGQGSNIRKAEAEAARQAMKNLAG